MGYYIDFIFDQNEMLNCEAIVQKLVSMGGRRITDEDIGPAAAKVVDVLFSDFVYPISVFRKESEHQKGGWADVRMSWVEDLASVRENLKYILDLAEKLGCRVYDGQITEYLTKDNLATVKVKFANYANVVTGLIGR